ncbi:type VII secretion protein EccB [Mycolicibacillus trivialis]
MSDYDDDIDDDRRSFASRTPVNDNPDRVVYRRGFVTKHQVSGWRFVMRRIASGVALHDARMLVEPLRTQSRSVMMGALITITAVLGFFVFSFLRPGGAPGNEPVLADRSTAALYVRLGDQLHPVLNLTSARLIVGKPVSPKTVKTSELDAIPRGNLLGIPGAPERMVQADATDADWTVCDAATGSSAGVTVIAGTPRTDGTRADTLDEKHAVLVDNGNGTWLLWDGKRSPIDLGDRAVTGALGWGVDLPTPRPIAHGLFNAIPEAPPLAAPPIPDAGQPPHYELPAPAPVGGVVVAYAADNSALYYAVLPDGLQPISPVLAALLRNTDSYGLAQPPRLSADAIAALPVSRMLDTARYPEQRLAPVDAAAAPVTCAHWGKPEGAATSDLSLLSGSTLPVPDGVHTVDLVGAAEGTASRVALPSGTGYFAQIVGAEPTSPIEGSLYWISDTGVRYGIDEAAGPAGDSKTVEALGLNPPALPIPWSLLTLFAPGPALSRADALIARDSVAPESRPGRTVRAAQETR